MSSSESAPKDKKASYKLFEQYLQNISGNNVVILDDGSMSTQTCTGFPSLKDESTKKIPKSS